MIPEDFIKNLTQETGIDQSQAQGVSEIMQSNFLSGDKNTDTITKLISEKLGVDEAKAQMICTTAVGLLSSGILDKINPFKK